MKLAILLVAIPFVAVSQVNRVLLLDGVADEVDIPDSPSLSNFAELTVEAWIYPPSGAASAILIDTVVCQYSSALGQRAYFISLNRAIHRMRVGINENTGGLYFDGQTPIPLDQWTHVAMTYDGSDLALYVNGQFDSSRPSPGPGITNFNIPHRIGSQAGSTTNYFPGLIDDVRIWNVARSQQQIEDDLLGLPTPTAPGLVGHWIMDDASTHPIIEDVSGFGNDGTALDGAHVTVVDPFPSVNFRGTRSKPHVRIGASPDAMGN